MHLTGYLNDATNFDAQADLYAHLWDALENFHPSSGNGAAMSVAWAGNLETVGELEVEDAAMRCFVS